MRYSSANGDDIDADDDDGVGEDELAEMFLPLKGSTSLERISSRCGENSVRGMLRSLDRKRASRETERPERLKIEPLARSDEAWKERKDSPGCSINIRAELVDMRKAFGLRSGRLIAIEVYMIDHYRMEAQVYMIIEMLLYHDAMQTLRNPALTEDIPHYARNGLVTCKSFHMYAHFLVRPRSTTSAVSPNAK